MKIYGNQTAVKEIMNLLDSSFIPPFMCRCKDYHNAMICEEQDFLFEEIYGLHFYMYEIEYNGSKILKCKPLNYPRNAGSGRDNILNGCVS
jgi:hypothetical protein